MSGYDSEEDGLACRGMQVGQVRTEFISTPSLQTYRTSR